MRLTLQQIQTIRQQIQQYLGESACVWLFGSRLDDAQRGGDIDLYVEAESPKLMNEMTCKVRLQEALDIPVDLIVRAAHDDSAIARIAKQEGICL